MHGGLAGEQIVRAVLDRVHFAAVVPLGVLAVFAVSVPRLDGRFQTLGVNAHGLAHLVDGVALHNHAARFAVFVLIAMHLEQAGFVGASLIEQHIGNGIGLFGNGIGNDIAAVELLHEALALFVHQQALVLKAHVAHVQKRTVFGVAHGVGLDVFHIYQVSARCLAHHDAVSRCAHRVGGKNLVVHIGVVLDAHLDVASKSARGQNHCLAGDGGLFTGQGVLDLHARDGIAVFDQLGGLRVVEQSDVVDFAHAAGELGGHLGAAVGNGDDGSLDVVPAKLHEVVLPRNACLKGEPLGRIQCSFGDDLNQLRIGFVVAAHEHVFSEVVGAVLDALLHLDPVAGRGHLAAREGGVATVDAHLLK